MEKKRTAKAEPHPAWVETGKRIKAAIRGKGLKQRDVAEDIGYTPIWFNKICNGYAELQMSAAKQLGKKLGVDWAWLLLESDYPNRKDLHNEALEDMAKKVEQDRMEERDILSLFSRYGVEISPDPDRSGIRKCTIDGQEYSCPEEFYRSALLDDIRGYLWQRSLSFKTLIRMYGEAAGGS